MSHDSTTLDPSPLKRKEGRSLQYDAGPPDGQRFPIFFSLYARVYHEFLLTLPLMEHASKRKIRFGIYTLNLTNHRNPPHLYNYAASPLFGQFAGFQHPIDGLVIDLMD
jgi:hypothetical protein